MDGSCLERWRDLKAGHKDLRFRTYALKSPQISRATTQTAAEGSKQVGNGGLACPPSGGSRGFRGFQGVSQYGGGVRVEVDKRVCHTG